eukprot:TRINITY_DN3091_c0_g1_i8.p1 TRINITY_DN3091_c0_g1~~TRINITY_DN3091_c0_g1_i8.p1  ORF type:complete len:118 (-),score=28.85 TRINITY_DN3091_c0_g1_i8:139-492(-)
MSSAGGRSRTCSESSETGDMVQGMCVVEGGKGMGYDVDGKFSYSQVEKEGSGGSWYSSLFLQVMKCGLVNKFQTTVDENGKFGYFKADMRPVPPGWYDLDKTNHRVPIGWYQMREGK